MTALDRGEDKLKFGELMIRYDQDDISGSCSIKSEKADSPVTPNISRSSSTKAAVAANVPSANAAASTPPSVDEKRMRREIANSNERRRMQSINAGFQSLRALLPHHVGEKLSKAAILQQAADYLYQLEQERTQLLSQNCHLKRIISEHEGELALNSSPPSPSKKRKLVDTSDDDVTNCDEFLELKTQLERERALRIHFEEKVQRLESLYTVSEDKLQDSLSTERITLQYHKNEIKDDSILHTFENGHELECGRVGNDDDDLDDDGTAHGVNAELKRPTAATTSVILQPVVAHEESLISPTVIGGHQYAASTVLMNQPICSPTANSTTTITTTTNDNPSSTSIKLKPRVDVERIGSPTSMSLVTTITSTHLTTTTTTTNSSPLICNNVSSPPSEQIVPSARVYLTSTSRQNLETIVEAIRHLEGDTLFESAAVATASTTSSSSSPCTSPNPSNQEVPLALTKRNSQTVLQVDMNPFLRFHTRQPGQGDINPAVSASTEQQQRPGVIVVKQQT